MPSIITFAYHHQYERAVLNENTLLVRLNPVEQTEEEGDDVMMSLFLDFLMKSAINDPSSLVAYTEEMSQEANGLLAEVEIDNNED